MDLHSHPSFVWKTVKIYSPKTKEKREIYCNEYPTYWEGFYTSDTEKLVEIRFLKGVWQQVY